MIETQTFHVSLDVQIRGLTFTVTIPVEATDSTSAAKKLQERIRSVLFPEQEND